MHCTDAPAHEIETHGFEEWPVLRAELLTFIEAFCADMTMAQAGRLYNQTFDPLCGCLNLP
ncbi:MAG TPA: hypothetical protein VFE17_00710 [Candidatus Baltobacteraceae bacterium]|jgi:hypothetical protein|nr:hypothetical protein [Candidatus Baltobacteraceae bacterium]